MTKDEEFEDDSEFKSGVRVIIKDLSENPHCSHGPTLLFSRTLKEGNERSFYACSACRDRKECSFFRWADEISAEGNKPKKEVCHPSRDLEKHMERISKLHGLMDTKRGYCHTCKCLFNLKRREKHKNHIVLECISNDQMRNPSKFLKPLQCSKKEAQFMFSDKSVKLICDILTGIDVTSVICIGSPSVHEYILEQHKGKMSSLLLDIDERYHDFFKPSEFCHYNMFNNYFFDGKDFQKSLFDVISNKEENVAIMMDPPFGGRVEPLVYTLQCLQKLRADNTSSDKLMPVLWAFPYFMEPHITGICPSFSMLDYKVDYGSQFVKGNNPRGSPVRLFTNISPNRIPLPNSEGYHHCSYCKRWVSKENKHCFICKACTSKDGRRYIHCKLCNRCVKPTWTHCGECNRCCLPHHKCGSKPPIPSACYCGSLNHVRKDCPIFPVASSKPVILKRKIKDSQAVRKGKAPKKQKVMQSKT